jgi:predicted Zn-dependent protease
MTDRRVASGGDRRPPEPCVLSIAGTSLSRVAPPTQDELLTLAERALAHAGGEAQATARWTPDGTAVEIAVVRDDRAGAATTTDLTDAGLARAAAEAAGAAHHGRPGARLGDPAPGRTHTGYDPAVLGLTEGDIRPVAEKVAIASSRGVRAFEQRTAAHLVIRREAPDGRALTLAEAAVGPQALDPEALAAEADELLGGSAEAAPVEPGEYPVVLAPWAVAEVLRRAAEAFAGGRAQEGPLAGRLGTRIVAPNINLSDSPRFPGTLPRSYDAEGVPRQPVPLIQDGVAHRVVHDSTSAAAAGAASTGHAARPGGLADPRPEHLVLVGGGAQDVTELIAPIERGLLIAALTPQDRAGTGAGADRAPARGAGGRRCDDRPGPAGRRRAARALG